jgi:hypothetical protein
MDWVRPELVTQIRLDASPGELATTSSDRRHGQERRRGSRPGSSGLDGGGGPLIPAGPFLALIGVYLAAAALVVVRLGRRRVAA